MITPGAWLELVVEIVSRRAVDSLTTDTPRSSPIVLARGDVLQGILRFIKKGNGAFNRVGTNFTVTAIALGDGDRITYCSATGISFVSSTQDPRIEYRMTVSGTDLDADLTAAPGLSISAFLLAMIQITSPTPNQTTLALREPVTIFKTNLNPLP